MMKGKNWLAGMTAAALLMGIGSTMFPANAEMEQSIGYYGDYVENEWRYEYYGTFEYDMLYGVIRSDDIDIPITRDWVRIKDYLGSDVIITVPEMIDDIPVREIEGGYDGFRKDVVSVTLPNTLTKIGSYTFAGNVSLAKISFSVALTTIGESAFNGCTGLTEVIIPESTVSIGEGAFMECSGLKKVEIPDSVAIIGTHAFAGCDKLKEITIPASVVSIGEEAFGYDHYGMMAYHQYYTYDDFDFTIYGYKDTAAETYALENGFTFIDLDAEPEPIRGDITNDGKLGVNDLVLLQKYLLGADGFTEAEFNTADLNTDGEVDVYDLALMKRALLQK